MGSVKFWFTKLLLYLITNGFGDSLVVSGTHRRNLTHENPLGPVRPPSVSFQGIGTELPHARTDSSTGNGEWPGAGLHVYPGDERMESTSQMTSLPHCAHERRYE